MSTPRRIQLSRRKGWRKPGNTVVVARPSKWGNPFLVNHYLSAEQAVAAYRLYLFTDQVGAFTREGARRCLRGKNLACWCKPGAPCHADVLLEVANR